MRNFSIYMRLFFRKSANLRQIVQIWTLLKADFILMNTFFCSYALLFYWKWAKFGVFLKYKLTSRIIIAWFFCINKLLFHWKSVKFTTHCQNTNFPSGCYFLIRDFFLYKYAIKFLNAGFFATQYQFFGRNCFKISVKNSNSQKTITCHWQ